MGTFSSNKLLYEPALGGDANSWGSGTNSLNTNMTILDTCLGGALSLSVAGSSDATLTAVQARNCFYTFTGVLTGSISVIWPAAAGGFYFVKNSTSGSFTLTVKPSGGTGVTVPQGQTSFIFINAGATTAANAFTNFATLNTSGNAAIGGTLGVTGDFAINTNTFNVTASSGNTSIAGTLGVTGHTTFEGVTSTGATGTGKLVYDASPTLSGTPLAPTAASGTNTTQISTTAFVRTNILPKVVTYTRDITTASGNQTLTGAGFTPRAAIVFMNDGNTKRMSVGMADGGAQFCVLTNGTTGQFGSSGSNFIFVQDAPGATEYQGASSSFNSDGMVIAWTKVGTPTGTISFTVMYFH